MQVVSYTLVSLMPLALSIRPPSTELLGSVGFDTTDAARRLVTTLMTSKKPGWSFLEIIIMM